MLGLSANMTSDAVTVSAIEALPLFVNNKSLVTDGIDDTFDITLPTDIINHDAGTISLWVKVDASNTASSYFVNIYDSSQTTLGRIEFYMHLVYGTNIFGLEGFYRDEITNGSFTPVRCQAKTAPAYHGEGASRIYTDFGDFGSGVSVYNAENMKGAWHHIAMTWDTSATYTHSSTTYNGVMKVYFDGVLRNEGVSTNPAYNSVGSPTGLTGFDSGTVLDTIRVGGKFNNSSYMDALTDELSVFDAALSDSDISDIYNSGTPADLSSYSSLIGWWRFEDNADDSSSNSNSGSLQNGARYSTTTP